MLAHNAVTDAQTKTSSLADLFGREERIEDAIRMNDSMTVILKCTSTTGP